MTPSPQADPTTLYRYRDSVYAADLLIAAVAWLDFFTWLDSHPSDLATICQELGLVERPADVMCTLLASMGLIQRRDGVFVVTPLGAYLVAGTPDDLGPYYASLRERPACRELLGVLRTGEPATWGSSEGTGEWARRMQEPEFAERFTAAMDARGHHLGPALAEVLDCAGVARVLDVAGGSGIYACSLLDRYPHLRATILERPPVDTAARTLLARRGYASRAGVVGADMFADPLPVGHDLHLFSHVLHDWGELEVRRLIAASYAALPPGGVFVDHDTHLDADKCGPLPVAEYSVLLMHSTKGKCWSVGELEGMLRGVGFTDVAVATTAADRSIITARKPGQREDPPLPLRLDRRGGVLHTSTL